MEPLKENKDTPLKWFLVVSLLLLLIGMFFGVIGGLQYVVPGFLKESLSFEKIRPLHVSSVLFWILLAASGCVLFYTRQLMGNNFYSIRLAKIQLALFTIAVLLILASYFTGTFGGREYWEFPPALGLLIIVSWILFVVNYTKSVGTLKNQPVYIWMWLTGAVGFLFIFSESYLWMLPYFQKNIVRDMTVQWKSYGSMVGCWNMLIYGTGLFLMEKISGDKSYAKSPIAFALFFLGLLNLFFNWSHHIYTLPVIGTLRHVGYLVSMTELLILGRIIYKWKSTLTTAQKFQHLTAYRFLLAADVWVFFNLALALLMSVPAINIYTHGTHITVVHAMGTTIGINSLLLMAACFDILEETCQSIASSLKQISLGYWLINVSLLVFLVALIVAGVKRSQWQMSEHPIPFSSMMESLAPYFITFTAAGILLFIGFTLVAFPLIRNFIKCQIKSRKMAGEFSEFAYSKLP